MKDKVAHDTEESTEREVWTRCDKWLERWGLAAIAVCFLLGIIAVMYGRV